MASAENQKPTCPVCNRSDQVKTTQSAYDSGVARCAPPDMPTRRVSMLSYILFSAVLVGICIFLIIVLIGSEASLGPVVEFVIVGVTLISILVALTLSYIAFQRVVRGDAEATELFPAWDRAMAEWRNLYYCSRDDIVFDPKTKKALTDEQLERIRTVDEPQALVQSPSAAR